VIAFIGTVFSPWYHWSGRGNPLNHVCINVATYGPGGRFAMTERGEPSLQRRRDSFAVGPSGLHWDGAKLSIDIDERAAPPVPGRIRGQIVLTPSAVTGVEVQLTPDGRHLWTPFAPVARIAVDLGPGWRWEGHGYFDGNRGSVPLEADFTHWTWGRFPTPEGAVCFYDGVRTDRTELSVAMAFDANGNARLIDAPPMTPLAPTMWRIRRGTRCDAGGRPAQVRALLEAPFYSRALVRTRIAGADTVGVHETLDLTRYARPLVKAMVALRVPRRPRA
jgi:carotenoid 1,2-hydratase